MSDFGVNRPVTKLIWLLSQTTALIKPTLEYLHAQDPENDKEKQQEKKDIYELAQSSY
jgi:hypothetical protein